MITKRKTAKKGSKKEKRESKKGKEECTRRQICVAPLSESIIGHIGRPQHIPLPLNEYPSTLTGRSYNVCWQKKNYSKTISLFAFSPLLWYLLCYCCVWVHNGQHGASPLLGPFFLNGHLSMRSTSVWAGGRLWPCLNHYHTGNHT